jgi:excinuclease ABC subunit A
MENTTIIIKGARQHNLKNVSVTLPKNKLIVFTGVSGSGKSSLAFDTIYAEGQRRYVESLSSYARQFLGIMDKPDVESIEGLSPAISIDQKSTSHNPRSTVGTITEIYDYLRLLYARIGHPHCPNCKREITRLSTDQIVDLILEKGKEYLEDGKNHVWRFCLLSPIVRDRKGEFSDLLENVQAKGFRYVRIDGKVFSIKDSFILIKTNKHSIDVLIDSLSIDKKQLRDESLRADLKKRISEGVEQATELSSGLVYLGTIEDPGFSMPEKPKNIVDAIYSEQFACPVCGISMPEIEPRTFSFNSPHGACPTCSGIGMISSIDPQLIISPMLSISEGGILPFAKMFFHDTWFSRVVQYVCKTQNIDTQIPLGKLSKKQTDIILFGTGDLMYEVAGTNRFGEKTVIHETFPGLVEELKRRYKETQSDFVRNEIEKYMRSETCPDCNGARLNKESLTITVDHFSISEVTRVSITDAILWFQALLTEETQVLSKNEKIIGIPIIKEIITRLQFLKNVGLEYLTLDRGSATLSGGEAQRIRLASQIGSGLSGVLYILDEPSIGLHQKDNKKLIQTLVHLRDLGNTVIVVEHDKEMMLESNHLVDFGPGAGDLGGTVVSQGSPTDVMNDPHSVTGKYLSGKKTISRTFIPSNQLLKEKKQEQFTIIGCTQNNLKNVTATFPLGKFICVTGVSGSGKSSLIVDTLYGALAQHCFPMSKVSPGKFTRMEGASSIDKVILIDQSPIGRTPRSNPATYTGLFTHIRDLFSMLPESKTRGFTSGRFSFNVKGGRCEACEGEGQKKIEMQFLSDVYVTCDVCKGARYNSETLEVLYKGKNISQILALTIDEALEVFKYHATLSEKLKTLHDVGLGYMHLGQPATTLSGGEAQRVKLASELSRRATGHTVYILDEPTTGLHFQDLEKLLTVFERLINTGNTVIVVEHNLDIIRNADWIIDMGPDGGDQGGTIIATGTPNDIAKNSKSYTGMYI